jgi:hypothetical protein
MLDRGGAVTRWNDGAQRFKDYQRAKILGRHFSCLYTDEDQAAGLPARALRIAAEEGRFENEGWPVRKDEARFWADLVIDRIGELIDYAKITRDLTVWKAARKRCTARSSWVCWCAASPTRPSPRSTPKAARPTGTSARSGSSAIGPTRSAARTSRASTTTKTARTACQTWGWRPPGGRPDLRPRTGGCARMLPAFGPIRHRRGARRRRRAARLRQDHPRLGLEPPGPAQAGTGVRRRTWRFEGPGPDRTVRRRAEDV